jgi:hypothetical protein
VYDCGAASWLAYAAPPNSVRVTAVTKLTINLFAFILLLSVPSPLVRRPVSVRLYVLRLLGGYFRPYSSAYEEAATSAATVRQRPQTGVKLGSSFVQDGLFLVLVVAAIW